MHVLELKIIKVSRIQVEWLSLDDSRGLVSWEAGRKSVNYYVLQLLLQFLLLLLFISTILEVERMGLKSVLCSFQPCIGLRCPEQRERWKQKEVIWFDTSLALWFLFLVCPDTNESQDNLAIYDISCLRNVLCKNDELVS